MIYLYHGTPGAGKTNYIVEKILEDVEHENSKPEEERRPIFANIMGLDISGVEVPPDDFRQCPNGSIIYYDEAQEIPHYSSDSRATNPVAKALSVHRSRYGVDIHFITQDPSLLHKYVIKNTGLHTYLWRPANRKSIDVYIWPRAIVNPNKTDFKNAYDTFKRSLNPKAFEYYESTPLDTHKKVKSKKHTATIMTALIFFAMIAYFIVPFMMSDADEPQEVQQALPVQTAQPIPAQPVQQPESISEPTITSDEYIEMEKQRVASVILMGDRCVTMNPYGHYLDKSMSECVELLERPLEPSYLPYIEMDNGFNRAFYQPYKNINSDPTQDLQTGLEF